MTTITRNERDVPVPTSGDRLERQGGTQARKAKPVKWWAGLGAFFVAFQIYLYTRWVFSDSFRRTSPGPDKVPAHMSFMVTFLQTISFPALFVCIYFFVIRPWRRDGKVGLLGFCVPAILTMYWQDLLANYFNPVYTYNGKFWNRGSWYQFIPGFRTPNASHMLEPLAFSFPTYVYAMLVPAIGMAWIMRQVKRRWPQLGVMGMLLSGFGVFAPLLLLLEQIYIRTGAYVYAGTIPSMSIFSSHYYQYPYVYEFFFFGFLGMSWACLVYFTNDKGDSMVEGGIHEIKATDRRKGWLRFFALSGYLNVTFLLLFNLPMMLVSLMPGFTWTKDVVDRSYLRMELCGGDTGRACPSSANPVPSQGSSYINQQGKLVIRVKVHAPKASSTSSGG